ncbi:MAG: hypothetical protein U5O39_15195 [Gammaproteobacteria bacterium]|nr:hypothetical protein [Gammaproteobacteria bacterium]
MDINEGPAGALWFATATRGVGRICDGRPELFGARDGLFSNHIKRLTPGPDQSLWLASRE